MAGSLPCYGSDLWTSDSPSDIAAAKELCGDCPLSQHQACRAAGWEDDHGVYGGLSAADRRKLDPLRMARATKQRQTDSDDRDLAIVEQQTASNGVAVDTPRARGLAMVACGESTVRVAAALGVPPGTVRSWVARQRSAKSRSTMFHPPCNMNSRPSMNLAG